MKLTLIIKDGKRYYPVEIQKIVSANGRIIYDRSIWGLSCPLADCRRRHLRDSIGDSLMVGRYSAFGKTEYLSAYSADVIDNFITEVLK